MHPDRNRMGLFAGCLLAFDVSSHGALHDKWKRYSAGKYALNGGEVLQEVNKIPHR